MEKKKDNGSNYDFLFICPIEEEFDTLIELCPIKSKYELDGFPYYIIELPKKEYRVITILLGEAGLTKAAQLTERFLANFSITSVCLLGLAGGIDPDLKLGDIVIPNEIIDYLLDSKVVQKGKNSYEFQPSIHSWNINSILIEYIRHFRYRNKEIYEKWQNDVNKFRHTIDLDDSKANLINDLPIYKIGHLASGNIVAGSDGFKEELKSRDRKLLAIDMEAAGVARSVFNRMIPPLSIVIRGISDFSDKDKSKMDKESKGLYRKYAVYSAIQFLLALIESRIFEEFNASIPITRRTPSDDTRLKEKVAELLKKANNNNIRISEILPEVFEYLSSLNKKIDISWIKAEISGKVDRAILKNPELFSYRKIYGLLSASAIQYQGFYSLINFRNRYKEYFIEHSIPIVEPIKELEEYANYKNQQIIYFTEGEAHFYTEILEIKKVLLNIRLKLSELLLNS